MVLDGVATAVEFIEFVAVIVIVLAMVVIVTVSVVDVLVMMAWVPSGDNRWVWVHSIMECMSMA